MDSLIKAYTSFYEDMEQEEDFKSLYLLFLAALGGSWIVTQESLAKVIDYVAEGMESRGKAVLQSPEFLALPNADRARIIREKLQPGMYRAYERVAKYSQMAYERFLQARKVPLLLPALPADDKPKIVTAKAINMMVKDEGWEGELTGFFNGFPRTAQHQVVAQLAKKLADRGFPQIVAQRVINSRNPCGQCLRHAGKWFRASSFDLEIYRFHPRCACRLIIRQIA